MKASKLILLIPLFFLMACSAAYEQVKEMDTKNPNTFQQHLLNNYKINASFEAKKCTIGILQNFIQKKH